MLLLYNIKCRAENIKRSNDSVEPDPFVLFNAGFLDGPKSTSIVTKVTNNSVTYK
jgi:hypothetical protein